MRLTKQTGHAIRILIDCANADGELIKVAEIADHLGITKQNAFKIVHVLSRAGLLAAVRGPNGGVRLAQPAEDIRIGEVVRAIETTDVEIDGYSKSLSGGGTKAINNVFDDALAAFVSVLDQHTLAEMARARRNKPAVATKTATGDAAASPRKVARGTGKPASGGRRT